MSNDQKIYGGVTVRPPLNWGQMTKFLKEVPKGRDILLFDIQDEVSENDEGVFLKRTCDMIEPISFDNAWGVVTALAALARVAPENEFVGDFTIVDEYPQFNEGVVNAEAKRYSISEGKLYCAVPMLDWTEPREL